MTPGLKIFTSNRLEFLVDEVAHITRTPLMLPLQPEIIVVQSLGMARWLSLQLAERNKICANYEFLFPNAFVHRAFQSLLPDLPGEMDCRPEILLWKIMQHLPARLGETQFADLQNYLGH